MPTLAKSAAIGAVLFTGFAIAACHPQRLELAALPPSDSALPASTVLPDVTVTAPAVPVEPPYMRNPWKSYERNPYAGRNRVEEDKFPVVPCNVTRIASSAGGKCLQGPRLVPGDALVYSAGGLNCDMALDVVMYSTGNLAIEASALIFDPYRLVATGLPNRWCYVRSHPTYDREDFQDMNQVTRRGTNWRNLVGSGEEDKSI
jgi:hypothetical protein